MNSQILLLAGDGIGPEIMQQNKLLLNILIKKYRLPFDLVESDIGGIGVDRHGSPLPKQTLRLAQQSKAILLGAIGGPRWDNLERSLRPETGLLQLRSGLTLFANLRPIQTFKQLCEASSLKSSLVSGLDLLIVRELMGGLYFGTPRGIHVEKGQRIGINTLMYSESEIRRIAKIAFTTAESRKCKLHSIDKANVLESSELWRDVVTEVAKDHPTVSVHHMYVDNAAMQLVKDPNQFDVLLTSNLFGDILSDLGAMLSGSIGMLPSASLGQDNRGLYEPIHGSAPDIVGRGVANPIAMMLSSALLFRHTFAMPNIAKKIEDAVDQVLDRGLRTPDIYVAGTTQVSTDEMGSAICKML